jgi:hypothetical protein
MFQRTGRGLTFFFCFNCSGIDTKSEIGGARAVAVVAECLLPHPMSPSEAGEKSRRTCQATSLYPGLVSDLGARCLVWEGDWQNR